jgi:hypothetical protein
LLFTGGVVAGFLIERLPFARARHIATFDEAALIQALTERQLF